MLLVALLEIIKKIQKITNYKKVTDTILDEKAT